MLRPGDAVVHPIIFCRALPCAGLFLFIPASRLLDWQNPVQRVKMKGPSSRLLYLQGCSMETLPYDTAAGFSFALN
jgi:hypothetical protein